MPGRDEWIAVVQRITDAAGPARDLAMDEARVALHRMPWVRDPEVEDLVHDKLHAELAALLGATDPRAFFCTMIRRAALSLRRKELGARREAAAHRSFVSVDDAELPALPADDAPVDEVVARRRHAEEVVAQLSERERQVFVAIAYGEDRNDIAAALGTSRENIDQIVSRARRRIGGAP